MGVGSGIKALKASLCFADKSVNGSLNQILQLVLPPLVRFKFLRILTHMDTNSSIFPIVSVLQVVLDLRPQ